MRPIDQAERFEKLAAIIEEHEDQFDMELVGGAGMDRHPSGASWTSRHRWTT